MTRIVVPPRTAAACTPLTASASSQVREQVTQRSLVAKRQMELKDMIIEDEVPDIGCAPDSCNTV